MDPIRIEQMTDENVLILLNDGIGAVLTAYEAVETVSLACHLCKTKKIFNFPGN